MIRTGPSLSPSTGPLPRALRRRLQPLRRVLVLHRRRWAAALVLTAALTAAAATSPEQEATTPVVVAAADLPGGSLLDSGDLRLVALPEGLAPAYAPRRISELLGRRLAARVREGEIVAAHRLAGSEQREAAPGLTTVPVRIADGAALLRPGDVIDLVAADGSGGATTIARGLPVVSTGGISSAAADAPSQSGSGSGDLVLIAAPASQVDAVVGASSAGYLLYAFTP